MGKKGKALGLILLDPQYRAKLIVKLYLALLRKQFLFKPFILMVLKGILFSWYHILISTKAQVEDGLCLPHPMNIVVGDYSKIGKHCTLYHEVTLGQSRGQFPVLGDHVIVYAGAKIMGNVKIGDYAVIGANAVVVKDVAPYQIVGGVPAKVIGENRDGQEFY